VNAAPRTRGTNAVPVSVVCRSAPPRAPFCTPATVSGRTNWGTSTLLTRREFENPLNSTRPVMSNRAREPVWVAVAAWVASCARSSAMASSARCSRASSESAASESAAGPRAAVSPGADGVCAPADRPPVSMIPSAAAASAPPATRGAVLRPGGAADIGPETGSGIG
jgi:hypothetical protein